MWPSRSLRRCKRTFSKQKHELALTSLLHPENVLFLCFRLVVGRWHLGVRLTPSPYTHFIARAIQWLTHWPFKYTLPSRSLSSRLTLSTSSFSPQPLTFFLSISIFCGDRVSGDFVPYKTVHYGKSRWALGLQKWEFQQKVKKPQGVKSEHKSVLLHRFSVLLVQFAESLPAHIDTHTKNACTRTHTLKTYTFLFC